MKDVMIDLELLSPSFDGNIIQIGAVVFDMFDNNNYDQLLIDVSPKNQDRLITGETVQFWMNQDIRPPSLYKGGKNLKEALVELHNWMPKECRIWAKGHDYFVLDHAYKQYNMIFKSYKRRFYNYMALTDALQMVNLQIKYDRIGNLHNALDDAMTQTKHLQKLMEKLAELTKS